MANKHKYAMVASLVPSVASLKTMRPRGSSEPGFLIMKSEDIPIQGENSSLSFAINVTTQLAFRYAR